MQNLNKFLGVEEGQVFKFGNTKNVEIINSIFKVENNKLLIKRDRDKTFGYANIGINELITLEAINLPSELLTEEERAYLKAVIAPVKDRINWVSKVHNCDGETAYLLFKESKGRFNSYNFNCKTEYKGLKSCIKYTLKDLGLD